MHVNLFLNVFICIYLEGEFTIFTSFKCVKRNSLNKLYFRNGKLRGGSYDIYKYIYSIYKRTVNILEKALSFSLNLKTGSF